MRIVLPEKWTPCDNICLEHNADLAVRTNKNILIVAGPGAGKTELLAQKASFLFQTNTCRYPLKILAISFKKDAAENLKQRVVKRCGAESEARFVSMTYDAFSKSILDHFRFSLPDELRPNADYLVEDSNIINEAFKNVGFSPNNMTASKLRSNYQNILADVELPFTNNSIGVQAWRLLLNGFNNHKATLSFKMICILAEYIIRTNLKIKRGLQCTYKHIFLDEFQDTTDLQYKLIKQCFMDSDSILTAVGDNKQRIMLWAGARRTVFNDFVSEFKADTLNLTMNHRSAPRLVDLQIRMYDSLKENNTNIKCSPKWNSGDGSVSLVIAEDDDSEAEEISKHITANIKSGIAPNDLCILCKQKPKDYTTKIVDALRNNNIYARVEDEYQGLIKEPIIEVIIALLKLSINIRRPSDWEFVVATLSSIWNIGYLQSNDDYSDMLEDINSELKRINKERKNVACNTDFESLVTNIVSFLGIEHVKASFPAYNQGTYLQETLDKFIELMWKELEESQKDWMYAIERFQGLHSVPIMSIHKSKGLEYDTVYFIGLEDSAFWNFRNQPEEDRCAFFVALSRAKRSLLFTFCKNRYSRGCYRSQSHAVINEFYGLLTSPGIATVVKC